MVLFIIIIIVWKPLCIYIFIFSLTKTHSEYTKRKLKSYSRGAEGFLGCCYETVHEHVHPSGRSLEEPRDRSLPARTTRYYVTAMEDISMYNIDNSTDIFIALYFSRKSHLTKTMQRRRVKKNETFFLGLNDRAQ